ncbi:MAG: hypothetical protein QOI34_921, partial [Verrucomicrobiota bacterium]
ARTSPAAFQRSANWNGRNASFNRIANFNRTGSFNRPSNFNRTTSVNRSGNLSRNGNWNRSNLNNWNGRRGNFSRNGNWRRRHCDDRFVFFGSFGYTWYFPYSYYGYDPYGYGYGYDPYAYSSYGDPAYNQTVYQGDAATEDYIDYNARGGDANGPAYDGDGDANGSLVAQVQQRLARGGYYKGPIDGASGRRTYYAIRAYQRDHHLRVDGAITGELLSEMRLR